MLEGLCLRPLIEKTRFAIRDGGLKWEIDEFMGLNYGLAITEVEQSDEVQQVRAPSWPGADVTHSPRYFNHNLVEHPYAEWRRGESADVLSFEIH